MTKPIKLRDIPRDSKIYCEVSDGSSYIIFKHLDGMYSYCETEKGGYINLHRNTPLEKAGDGYKILRPSDTHRANKSE